MQAPITTLLAANDHDEASILGDLLKNDSVFNNIFHCLPFKTENELISILLNTAAQVLFFNLAVPNAATSLAILKKINQDHPNLLIIAIIPNDDEDLLESVLELDIFFYIHKPYDPAEIRIALKRAQSKLYRRLPSPSDPGPDDSKSFYGLIGQSQHMRQLFELIAKVAEDEFATVLIRGESGTGKELVAKAIHTHSKRRNKHFVPVNCAAIPDDLLESELFGYTKGAFTGASQNKIGRVEYADGGTLFLDEIGDMKPSLQAKLLRVLQEKEFEPVGGLKPCSVDTRVVAATHCDLEQLVSQGKFREDLYYRLSVIPLTIPPLKDRRDDIPLLLKAFTNAYSTQRGRLPLTFEPMAIKALLNYEWRGNVRELENLVQHLSILYSGKNVRLEDLPEKFTMGLDPSSIENQPLSSAAPQQAEPIEPVKNEKIDITAPPDTLADLNWSNGQINFNELIDDFERHLILQALKVAHGNKKEAARLLNLKRTTLLEKMKKKEMQEI